MWSRGSIPYWISNDREVLRRIVSSQDNIVAGRPMVAVHFIDVGQGNMVLCVFPDRRVLVYDCNITQENEARVLGYLRRIIPGYHIDIFVNSHRDADHMRGIEALHRTFPIRSLWDSGVSGNIDTPEYSTYMALRRSLPAQSVIEATRNLHTHGSPLVWVINGKRDGGDQNAQSIVLKIDYQGSSVLLTGDTDVRVWANHIVSESTALVRSKILLASHHGSDSFFSVSNGPYPYVSHMRAINPEMTVISVGPNAHGHPHVSALRLYDEHTRGSQQGQKVFRTDTHGTILLELLGYGDWRMTPNQV